MLWIKVAAALESVLLLTAPPVEPGTPTRSRRTSNMSPGPSRPVAQRGVHVADGDAYDFADGAFDEITPAPPAEAAFNAAIGRRLQRAVNETGPVLPGWGLTGRAFSFNRPSDAVSGPLPPGLTAQSSRTVWTHDLIRAASHLTATDWQESRATLGDDRWVSAGIAAWWALRHGIGIDTAASLLHRARSLAYRVFDTSDALGSGAAETPAHVDERLLLMAWVQARIGLSSITAHRPSVHRARGVLVQAMENACRDVATPLPLETLYLLVMADDLALRYDIDVLTKRYRPIWSPVLALKSIAYVRSVLLPKVESLDAIEKLPAAIQRGIDEAALLFFTVENDARQAWAIVCSRGDPSRAALRAAFVALMPDEKRDLELLDQLFRPTGVPGSIHHDGITLRNALGRTFEDLLASAEMQYPLGMHELPPARQRKLLARYFAQSNLSTRYSFGSVRHAVATTVERIASYRSGEIPDDLDTDAGLLEALRQARIAWTDADDGPSSTDLVLAGQLASSNEVRLETMETLRVWFDTAILEPFRRVGEQMRAEGIQGMAPREWLIQNMQNRRDENRPVPRGALPCEYQWAIDVIRRQKERIARDGKAYFFVEPALDRPASARNFSQIAYLAQRSAVYARAFLSVDPAELRREILIGDTWQARGEASLVYANERMLATFGAPPTLDIIALAAATLAAAGLNATETHAIRRIEILGNNAELREPITGSYIGAFVHTCHQVSEARHFFLPSGEKVQPLEHLKRAVEEFNARLPSDPWIRTAALESFRCVGTVPSSWALREAIDQHVQRYRIPSTSEILREEILDIRNLIPFYASSKAIYQGFTEKVYFQLLFGLITLASDIALVARLQPRIYLPHALFRPARRPPLARRGSAFTLSDGLTSMCGWPPSRTAFKSLRPWQELIEPPERLFDANLRLLPVRQRRTLQTLPEAVLPWGARRSIAMARAGVAAVRWNGFDVIFCRKENAVFLARHARDEYYAKIDWLTLQPAEPPEFIREKARGEFHSLEKAIPPVPPLFGDSLLADQPTVVQVTALLNNATDAVPRDFRPMFTARFDIHHTAAARDFQRNHPSRSYVLLNLLEDAYARSAIVRRVFHRFMETPTEPGASPARIPVAIDCGGLPTTAVSQTESDVITTVNAITLPVDQYDASLRYQSVRGTEPPALVRTVLHEFFHAWTRIPDPEASDERYHRGAVVWLTEAALRQLAHPVYPRIAYGVWDERVAASSEAYRNTILWSGMEDRLLEQRVLDLDMFDGVSVAYGVPVECRVTVSQVLSLLPAAANGGNVTTPAPIASRFASLFRASDARPGATPAHRAWFDTGAQAVIQHCATRSPLMQQLLEANALNTTEVWDLRMNVMPPTPDENTLQLYEVNFFSRQITVFSGMAHYLTPNGIRPFTMEMRILDAAIARLTEEKAPARQASPYLDRGAVVWLSDRILEESGYDFPRRLHRAILFEDYGKHSRQALEEFARARWAAEIEDRHIASVLAGNRTGNGLAPRQSA